MATGDFDNQPFERAGGLVPYPSAFDRKLLPYEKELCELIGCTEQEYEQFLEELANKSYIRPAEYDAIPAIYNGPETWVWLGPLLISLAVGVASTAISYFLTPKPSGLEDSRSRSISRRGRTGQDRFLQSTSFDGFADLAEFGDAIPIIWTRYTGTSGGVVIAPPLVWSRAFSLGNQQAAKLVYLVGEAGVGSPDIAGVFIGNTALKVQDSDTYIFAWDARPSYSVSSIAGDSEGSVGFAACLTPSNSTQFGVANPIPNCTGYRVNWQVVSYPEDVTEKTERDIRNQRLKICGSPNRAAGMPGIGRDYPRRLGVVSSGKDQAGSTFRISGTRLPRKPSDYELGTSITTEDINDALDAECIAADEILQVGTQLICGTQLVKVTSRSSALWYRGQTVNVQLSGAVKGGASGDIESTNAIATNASPLSRNYNEIYYPLCRAVLAVFRNNRVCQSTEIGIKSQVWGRINGLANFNRIPDSEALQAYDESNVQFSLGNNNEYFPRVSMFRIQMRSSGASTWGNVGGVIGVRGGTPTDQHFQARINHGTASEFEFRIVPVSSGAIGEGLRELLVVNPNAGFLTDGLLSLKATREEIFVNATTGELNPLFEVRAMTTKGWGNAYTTGTYVIPTAAVFYRVGIFTLAGASLSGLLINTNDEQTRLERAFFYEVFGDPEILNDVQIADYKVKSDRGSLRIKLKVKAINVGTVKAPSLRWQMQTSTIYDVRPIEDISFANGQTVNIPIRVRTNSLYLKNRIPVTIEDNRVELRLRVTFTAVTSKTLTPEERGWRLFEPYASFAEVSHYGNTVTHSCDSGPEHEVVYVNQIGGVTEGTYSGVNTALLALRSNRNIGSVDQVRLWIKSGINNSNSFPQLVQYLLSNVKGISPSMIDTASFAEADSFCNANGLYYDGAVTTRTNLRSFITSTAPFFLLNFVMRNGKMALLPALPAGGSAAMFTAGNIIENSFSLEYLDISERRQIRAEMIWRENRLNEFPRNRTIVLGDLNQTMESFDMSAFCTSEAHATKAGKYIRALRQYVTHAIKFKTTLDNANIGPGSIITVALGQTSTSRFNNGSISNTGVITATQNLADGSYPIVYFKAGEPSTQTATLVVSNGTTAQIALYGAIFSVTQQSTYTSTYLVEQVELDEEGLVSVSATEYPYNAIRSAVGI